MTKIYRVIQIKLNDLVLKMSICSLTYQQSIFRCYHSDKHFSRFLSTRWRRKSTGIDMEQNYVTVTLCTVYIRNLHMFNLHQIFMHATYCGSVLRRRCDVLCTSGFMDDAMFAYNGQD